MKIYGLLGKNISYSFSPILHKEIFKYLGLEEDKISYKLFDIEENKIKKLIKKIRENQIQGINITIPYKEKVIDFLDEISKKAKDIGAVNTIYKKDNKLIGENTDYFGFLETLKKLKVDIKKENIAILGSGGAAKAVLQVVKDLGAIPYIVSRDEERAKQKFQDVEIINYEKLKGLTGKILINCTPLGNKNHPDISPVSKEISLKWEYGIDLNYVPKISLFLSYFKEEKRMNGLYMLVAQGIKSEEFWQNKNMPIEDIYNDICIKVYKK